MVVYGFFLKHKKHCLLCVAMLITFIISGLFFIINKDKGKITLMHDERASKPMVDELNCESGNLLEGKEVIVDIAGEVAKPNVYVLPYGSRLYEAIEMAGGLTDAADTRNTNLAECIIDGTKIYIPTEKEAEEEIKKDFELKSGLININTADSTELQKLTGIGPSTAEKIITYRNEYGRFKRIEDIKNVSGIGDKTFAKFKNLIVVE